MHQAVLPIGLHVIIQKSKSIDEVKVAMINTLSLIYSSKRFGCTRDIIQLLIFK